MSDSRTKVKDFFAHCCSCWKKTSDQNSNEREIIPVKTSETEPENGQVEPEVDQQLKVQQQEQKLVDEDKQKTAESFDEAENHSREVELELNENELQMEESPPTPTSIGDSNDSPKSTERAPLMDNHESKRSLQRSKSALTVCKTGDYRTAFSPRRIRLVDPKVTLEPLSLAAISHARNRDFRPVWGSDVMEGMTGLKNLGNTCYMNSILQCLSNLKELAAYFMDREHLSSAACGDIAVEFSEVLRAIWCGQFKSIAPVDFKEAIGRRRGCFQGNDQQDAFEFLATLLDCLHLDISQVNDQV